MVNLMKALKFLVLLTAFTSCSPREKANLHSAHEHSGEEETSEAEVFYTCSMHPKIREPKDGKCPLCHMNLTKIEVENTHTFKVQNKGKEMSEVKKWQCKDFPEVISDAAGVCPLDGSEMIAVKEESQAAAVIAKVKLRASQVKHFNPAFFEVTAMKMTKKIRLLGSVLQSEERESSIPARIGGRVEKVYVRSTGSFIKKGGPVVDLYSPKLITAGEEYLLARQSYAKNRAPEFREMLKQSQEKLELWGVKKFQYEKWYRKQKIPSVITLYSDATGIVRKRNATIGKYFKEGQNLFELSDLSAVWIEMDVYEQDSAIVELGQSVNLSFTAIPGKLVHGTVDFVSPVLNSKSRTLKIRATIENSSGDLRPGMIADAVLSVDLKRKSLVVPRSAIIDTGRRKVVWVKVADRDYRAKVVRAAHESEGYVEIVEGLIENEEVVIEGNFLLDAQAQLFGGYEDLHNPAEHEH